MDRPPRRGVHADRSRTGFVTTSSPISSLGGPDAPSGPTPSMSSSCRHRRTTVPEMPSLSTPEQAPPIRRCRASRASSSSPTSAQSSQPNSHEQNRERVTHTSPSGLSGRTVRCTGTSKRRGRPGGSASLKSSIDVISPQRRQTGGRRNPRSLKKINSTDASNINPSREDEHLRIKANRGRYQRLRASQQTQAIKTAHIDSLSRQPRRGMHVRWTCSQLASARAAQPGRNRLWLTVRQVDDGVAAAGRSSPRPGPVLRPRGPV